MTDIVERLHGPEGVKAADEILRLRAENARLQQLNCELIRKDELEIIEALRAENARLLADIADWKIEAVTFGADTVPALRAENARLREALKPFAAKAEIYSEWAGTARDAVWFPISDLHTAREALGKEEN